MSAKRFLPLCLALLSWTALPLSLNAQQDRTAALPLNPQYAPFYHGVASGDPLSDRVILWTRVTADTTQPVTVNWVIATDTNLVNVVNSGTATTDDTRDYCVKVDATGLQPDTWYYYRFDYQGRNSLIGRTRTTPVAGNGADTLRFAVASCANFQTGYFNAYRHMKQRNDLDAVIFLGDYVYEYEVGGYGYIGDTSRAHEPSHENLNLEDYRLRHSQYKLDPDLRSAHQQYPWICVWDDHETANDAWMGGAANHDTIDEGPWGPRMAAGVQAYFEWMPVRQVDPLNDPDRLYRSFRFGDLMDLVMVDTRLEGRDEQVGVTDAAGLADTTRNLMGPIQLDWFRTQLSDTVTQWKIIGNQVMIAPVTIFGTPFSADQWDGYVAERNRVLRHITQNQIPNVVVLTGDIHTAWANDVPAPDSSYSSSTHLGSATVEFVAPSVTSPNTPLPIGQQLIQLANPWCRYIDLNDHGYIVLDVNPERVQGDYWYVGDNTSNNQPQTFDAAWCVSDGISHLNSCNGPSTPPTVLVPPAPDLPDNPVSQTAPGGLVFFGAWPNPTADALSIQFYLAQSGPLTLRLIAVDGRELMREIRTQAAAGLQHHALSLRDLPAGIYLLELNTGTEQFSRRIVKQ